MFCKRLLFIVSLCAAVCLHKCIGLSCNKVERCKCAMSDNSGEVNLKSLASSNGVAAFTVLDGFTGWKYEFNPCIGFSSLGFSDLSIIQLSTVNIDEGYVLGIQATEDFSYSSSSGLSLQYADSAGFFVRNSSVLLICEPGAQEHHLEFIGELITLQYEFVFTSPCACPGRCDDYGIIKDTTQPPTTTATTTETATTTTSAKPVEGMNWNLVGANLVSLLLHDLILIALIAFVFAIVKYLLGFSCNLPSSRSSQDHKQFTDA